MSRLVDRAVNRTAHPGRLEASQQAIEIHQRAPIVDMVVGSALFRDSFVRPGGRGHVDLPRLRAAGVNVVGLSVATAWPDVRGTLSRWHFRSLGLPASETGSKMAIAEWVIGRINRWCADSDGQMIVVRSTEDLRACLSRGGPVGVVIAVQGGHVLEDDLGNVARLRELGVRVLAPAHVMDNSLVGSSTGRRASGLTEFGLEVIAELEAQSVLVDLAHMSRTGIDEALPLLHRPFVLSHTGLTEIAGGRSRWRRYSPATRNIPALVANEIGQAGGLVGIVLSTLLLGGGDLSNAVATIQLAIESAGAAHVAIGSDMDGGLRTVIDIDGLPALTNALLESGLAEDVVRRVMGGNAVRFLESALPE
jgi:membrane dipeptidase